MKRWRAMVCILAALVLFCLGGCGAKDSIVGTWEAPVEMSVLGVGVESPQMVTSTVRFTFLEDGSGSMDVEAGEEFPAAQRPFQYSTEGDQITLEYAEGASADVFTFTLKGDALSLVNQRGSFDLTRVS